MAVNKSLFYKELSLKDSNSKVQALLKEKQTLVAKKHFQPGQLIFSSYNAKDKTKTYDKTPLALILKRGRKHTLVLNFHWIPQSMRLNLIKTIMKMNKRNIADGKPLEFDYGQLKPMLKSLGYAPCIRLYINARMGRIGVVIPPERLTEIARLKGESFTNGKYSSSQLFQMAKKRGKASAKPKSKR
jgi:hypothetical protein